MDFSPLGLPTILMAVPIAGGIIAMVPVAGSDRRWATAVSTVILLLQAAFLAVAVRSLLRFEDAGLENGPTCTSAAPSGDDTFLLAQCGDWVERWGVQYHVVVDWPVVGLVALATLVTAMAAWFSAWADRERVAVLQGLMWLSTGALIGLFMARDLVLFYVLFELLLLPMVLLVGRWGGTRRVGAAISMLVYTLLGSLPMLAAVAAVGVAGSAAIEDLAARGGADAAQAELLSPFSIPDLGALVQAGLLDLSGWMLAGFLVAFAVKAPLIPFHGWMPLAYREAPPEVTAMLSGLVSKAAYVGLLLVVLPLFATELAGGWGTALTWLALASLAWGALAAFRQPDARGVVAYSSLAQMGLITLGLAAAFGDGGEQGVGGAYLQAINHGLVSALLFLLVGIIEVRTGEGRLARLGALAAGRPRLVTIALFAALVALAVPGASTFAGELLILVGVFQGLTIGPLVALLGGITIVFAALYALRLVAGMTFTSGDEVVEGGATAREQAGGDLGARELAFTLPIVAALLLLSAWPGIVDRGMEGPKFGIPVAGGEQPYGPTAADFAEAEGDAELRELVEQLPPGEERDAALASLGTAAGAGAEEATP